MEETLYVKAVERKFVDHADRGEVERHTLILESGDDACRVTVSRLEPFAGYYSKQLVTVSLKNEQTTLEATPAAEADDDA